MLSLTQFIETRRLGRIFVKPVLAKTCLICCLAGSVQTGEPLAADALHSTCDPPPRAETIWARRDIQYVLIGETHGTVEAPYVFAELICAAAATGKRILVGLEFSESARTAFQKYLASEGTMADISSFLSGSDWFDMVRQSADGRTSIAMWKMIERLRVLRAKGMNISLTTFIRPIRGETQTSYEVGMARSLQEAASFMAYDFTIVLVGNLHARSTTFDPGGQNSFDPMAMHLPQKSTLSLLAISSGGEAWNCRLDCGPARTDGSPDGASSRVEIRSDIRAGYDGVVAIGPISASPPLSEIPL